MKATLTLTPEVRAIFTARAATEGTHASLPCPPGSVLLGWAAAGGRYDNFSDPFQVFHSGRVRFSNALPILPDGTPAYPMPQILLQPKHARGGVVSDRLVAGAVRVWHPEDKHETEKIQYDVIDNKGRSFVTGDGRVVRPRFGGRLRTATWEGRAARGQLFGYTHLEPGNHFAATIEADPGAITPDDWRRLLDAFRNKILFLGRGAGAYYGGDYKCTVEENVRELWQGGGVSGGEGFIRVWVLSDLALLDKNGAPCFAPTAEMLDLPPGGRLDPRESPIGARRYAPWNAHLGRRDVERQVIVAGSVLTFRYENGGATASTGSPPSAVGLWREAGLGRIWVAPSMLQVNRGQPPRLDEKKAPPSESEDRATPVPEPEGDPLIRWAKASQAAAVRRREDEVQAQRETDRRREKARKGRR